MSCRNPERRGEEAATHDSLQEGRLVLQLQSWRRPYVVEAGYRTFAQTIPDLVVGVVTTCRPCQRRTADGPMRTATFLRQNR